MVPASRICSGNIESGHSKTRNSKTFLHAIPLINQAVEAMGLAETQRLATIFDGITRHSPEGLNFMDRSNAVGWKQAVKERDQGMFDWTKNHVLPENES
jgi:hypothetical protein